MRADSATIEIFLELAMKHASETFRTARPVGRSMNHPTVVDAGYEKLVQHCLFVL
jgi:hypothetical protein